LFTIDQDTIPGNSLPPVTSIIDPRKISPGNGLPVAGVGQVYLVLSSIGDANTMSANQAVGWRNSNGTTTLINANDIIVWDGDNWAKIFDSQNVSTVEYVTNTYTGIQYKWVDGEWKKSWEGYYNEGFWSIVI